MLEKYIFFWAVSVKFKRNKLKYIVGRVPCSVWEWWCSCTGGRNWWSDGSPGWEQAKHIHTELFIRDFWESGKCVKFSIFFLVWNSFVYGNFTRAGLLCSVGCLNTTDWGMEQRAAASQAADSSSFVCRTLDRCEIGKTMALNLKQMIVENQTFCRAPFYFRYCPIRVVCVTFGCKKADFQLENDMLWIFTCQARLPSGHFLIWSNQISCNAKLQRKSTCFSPCAGFIANQEFNRTKITFTLEKPWPCKLLHPPTKTLWRSRLFLVESR